MSNIESAVEQREQPRDPSTGQFVAENAEVEVQSDKPLDFGNDEFANELAAEFESDRNVESILTPGAPAPASTDASPESVPSTEPHVEQTAPASPAPGSEQPAATEPPAEVAPPPGVPEIVSVGDWEIPKEQVQPLRELYDWATSLPPEAHQAINDLLSGNFYLVPRDPSQVTQPGMAPVQGSGEGAVGQPPIAPSATPPAATQIDPSEFLDPAAATHIQRMEAELAAMRASQADQERQRAEQAFRQQEQMLQAGLETAKESFAQKYGLNDQEVEQVIARTTQLQIIPSLIPRHPGNPAAAFVQGFEAAYFSDPTMRQREIDRQAAVEAQRLRDLQAKKDRASAVGAGSAPVARTEPARRPMSRDEQVDAMAEELAAHMNGN